MLCKDLREGMLLEITGDQTCGWFNTISHPMQKKKFSEIPPRFRVGSEIVGLMAVAEGISQIYRSSDMIMYLGTKQITDIDGKKSRQVRMIYVNGESGYIEGYDVKFLRPRTFDSNQTEC